MLETEDVMGLISSDVMGAKLGALGGLLTLTLFGAFAPIFMKSTKWNKLESFIAHFSFVTAGVFLGAGLVHMLPSSVDQYNKSQDCGLHSDCYPAVYMIAGCGFIIVWVVSNIDFTLPDKTQALAVATRSTVDPAAICQVNVSSHVVYKSDVERRTSRSAPSSPARTAVSRCSGSPYDREKYEADPLDLTKASSEPLLGAAATKKRRGSVSDDVSRESLRRDLMMGTDICFGHDRFVHGGSEGSGPAAESYGTMGTARTDPAPSSTPSGEDDEVSKSLGYPVLPIQDDEVSKDEGCGHEHGGGHSHGHGHGHGHGSDGSEDVSEAKKKAQAAHDECGDSDVEVLSNDPHEHASHHHMVFASRNGSLPFLIALCMSVHSLIGGCSLGIQSNLSSSFASVLIALFSHKLVEALAVGANFVKEDVPWQQLWPVLLLYCCMTPIGITTGMLVLHSLKSQKQVELAEGLGQGLASGSFLFIAVHELNSSKDDTVVPRVLQILLLVLGFGLMSTLAIWV